MKRLLIGMTLFMTACAASSEPIKIDMPKITGSYPDLGPAPELTNDVWLNVDAPLRLADLRGNVVAIDMWTFG